MTFARGWVRAAAVGLLLVGWTAGEARTPQNSPGQNPGAPSKDPFGQNPGQDVKTQEHSPFGDPEHKQAKLREEERQQRLVSDTDKLLQLATQLHEDVAKTDRHVLSLDVIKRADEIEKLAHAVKERMKG